MLCSQNKCFNSAQPGIKHPYLPPKLFGVPYDFARSTIGCFLLQPNLPLPCAAPGAGSRY